MCCNQGAQACRDPLERLVPAHALKRARAFWSDPPQGEEDAVRAVNALQVVIDLRTQNAPGERMVWIADQLDHDPLLDSHLPGTGVGSIMWAGATNDRGCQLLCVIHSGVLQRRERCFSASTRRSHRAAASLPGHHCCTSVPRSFYRRRERDAFRSSSRACPWGRCQKTPLCG